MSEKKGMADAVALRPLDADDKKLLRVILETPKGSRDKFAYNEEERILELKKVLAAGMGFPYDFGFVPSTKADDRGWAQLPGEQYIQHAFLWKNGNMPDLGL